MSKYERAYGTDWERLDKDEAIDRAYALGVAASLGESHPDELDAVRAEMDTAYNKSVVDLAFDEGRTEARKIDAKAERDDDIPVWAALVEGEPVAIDEGDAPTGGRDGLPDALARIDALDRSDLGTNEAIERPDFLEKD